MDPTRWQLDIWWDIDDRPDGVALRCLSCAGVGIHQVEGETLAEVMRLATDHDRIIHRR